MTENTTKSPNFHSARLIGGLLVGMGIAVMEGCTYDVNELPRPCGHSDVSFAGDVLPLDVHCNGCHSWRHLPARD